MWKSPIMKFYIAFIKLIFVSKRSKLSERKDVMNINILLLAILFWSKYFYKRTYICLCFCVHKYTCRISLESIIISYPSHSECLKFYYKWWFLPVFFINTYTLGSFCLSMLPILQPCRVVSNREEYYTLVIFLWYETIYKSVILESVRVASHNFTTILISHI